jgi:hypothetical protein
MSQGFFTAYTPAPEPVKLSELRAKTDRQLSKLIHSKLELGLTFLALVEETCSDGNPDHAERVLRRAEQAVTEVKQLLPVLSEEQRRGFAPTVSRLQESLDRFRESPKSYTASTC